MENQKINLIKIIAIVLVIFNHTYMYLLSYSGPTTFMKIGYVLCRIAVPLFIICTGFLLCKKETNWKVILKRIKKVLIPLFLFSILIYYLRGSKIDFLFFKEFLSNPIIEPYWYLYMIIGLYIFIPFINNMIKNIDNQNLIILIILVFIPSILSFFNIVLSPHLFLSNFSYIIGYYLVGALFSRINISSLISKISLLVFISLILYGFFNYDLVNLFYIDNIFIVCASISFFLFIYGTNFVSKWNLSPLAKLIFGVYLIHPILQNKIYELSFIQSIFQRNANLGLLLLQIIIIVICFGIVFFYKKIIELFMKIIKNKSGEARLN